MVMVMVGGNEGSWITQLVRRRGEEEERGREEREETTHFASNGSLNGRLTSA